MNFTIYIILTVICVIFILGILGHALMEDDSAFDD